MEKSLFTDDVKLALLIISIFIITIIAFWSLLTVFVWAVAIASALLPIHQRLCRTVKPAVSATFITVWVLLLILLVMALAASVLMNNQTYISDMALRMITGLKNTQLSRFLPTFSDAQLSHFNDTLTDLMIKAILSLTGNIMQLLLSIIIFFLSLSMMLYYGEHIWKTMTCNLSPKLSIAVNRLSEISANTIYALIIVQISAAVIAFGLAIPFFYFLGVGNILLFSAAIGFAMLIPLIGAQLMILILALYFLAIGDVNSALIMLFVGYPLLSGWIDFYYRPMMMGKRVAIHPVLMMIGIFAGVPFMGVVGFIVGPVLVALTVTGYKIITELAVHPDKNAPQGFDWCRINNR